MKEGHEKKNNQKMKSYSHFKRSLSFAKLISQNQMHKIKLDTSL